MRKVKSPLKASSVQVNAGQRQYTCVGCGAVFWKYPSPGRGKYCSRECARTHQPKAVPHPISDPMVCLKCRASKPRAEFYAQSKHCRSCQSEVSVIGKRRSHLWSKFKITLEDWIEIYRAQEGRCPICNIELPELDQLSRLTTKNTPWSSRNWNTDHCHTSGKVRGILCRQCNVGLGAFRENLESLARAAEYIKRHSTP